MCAGLIVEETYGLGNFQFRLRVERVRARGRAVGRAENIEIVALRSGVSEIEQPISAERRFCSERPDLSAAIAVERIYGGGVENPSRVSILNLQQSCLQNEWLGGRCELRRGSCERRLVGEVVC